MWEMRESKAICEDFKISNQSVYLKIYILCFLPVFSKVCFINFAGFQTTWCWSWMKYTMQRETLFLCCVSMLWNVDRDEDGSSFIKGSPMTYVSGNIFENFVYNLNPYKMESSSWMFVLNLNFSFINVIRSVMHSRYQNRLSALEVLSTRNLMGAKFQLQLLTTKPNLMKENAEWLSGSEVRITL